MPDEEKVDEAGTYVAKVLVRVRYECEVHVHVRVHALKRMCDRCERIFRTPGTFLLSIRVLCARVLCTGGDHLDDAHERKGACTHHANKLMWAIVSSTGCPYDKFYM